LNSEKNGRFDVASQGDRFIPNRGSLNIDVAHLALMADGTASSDPTACIGSPQAGESSTSDSSSNSNDHSDSEYKSQLSSTLLNGASADDRILAFKHKAPLPAEGHQNNLRVLYSQNRARSSGAVGSGACKKAARIIPQAPERILDAPDIVDDYYLNLLDWSKDNVLAIALDKAVYLWDASSGDITQLCALEGEQDVVTSLQWVKSGSGAHLAIGTNSAVVQLWDVARQKQLREMRGHQGRVSSLSWNKHMLSSGSRDSQIINHDVRVAQHITSTYASHSQEVCGLAWSHDGAMLASGGNDNLLLLWDARTGANAPAHRLTQHQAAVKALAWCPWQANLLVSGAGTADRHLRFWNTVTGACVNSIDTGSQVCAVQWSRHQRELVSSHGFAQNQLSVWSYPSLSKVADLNGHSHRVLHMAQSPDGQTICSAGADETLRFWKVWAPEATAKKRAAPAAAGNRMLANMNIR
jgi:cell division cycle protein 20 (cofactor of APC complex)